MDKDDFNPYIEMFNIHKDYIIELQNKVKTLEEKVNSMEANWKCISGTLDKDVLIGSDDKEVIKETTYKEPESTSIIDPEDLDDELELELEDLSESHWTNSSGQRLD